jgi:hypothetical protein
MKIEQLECLSINCPEWFARPDFQAWLQNAIATQSLATWHKAGDAPNEFSDTFITYDNGDGSDFDENFPEDIHAELVRICQHRLFQYGILRLTNLEE